MSIIKKRVCVSLPVDSMGLSLVLNRLVVGWLHVAAGIAVAVRHVAPAVVDSGRWCTNCSVRLDVVAAAAIVVAIPIAGDNSHWKHPADLFAHRQIDADPSTVVAKILMINSIRFHLCIGNKHFHSVDVNKFHLHLMHMTGQPVYDVCGWVHGWFRKSKTK